MLEEIMIQACDEARSIAHQSMPEALFHLGIKEAIEDLVLNLQDETTEILTHFQGIEMLSLKKHTVWVIYLAIKELIQHLISKSDINRVEFLFSYQDGKAQIQILDDATQSILDAIGSGQEPHSLRRIKSKINYLGGEIDFLSGSEQKGNNIAIQFAA